MSKNAMDRLIEAIERTKNPTAMGMDTQFAHIPPTYGPERLESVKEKCAGLMAYNQDMLDAMVGVIPCVKVQVAYYEMYGLAGMYVFSETLRMARERGYITIADVKRGDIGATSEAYAKAYLEPGADFEADFITVNGYLGTDGIQPFVDLCEKNGKGIFVLVKTSNPSSGEVQDVWAGQETIYEKMADLVMGWGKGLIGERGYSSVGAVVGATYPEQGTALRRRLANTFFLVPGYGAQGATGKDLRGCFDAQGSGAVVNASRSLLAAHAKAPGVRWEEALRNEAVRMRGDIAEG